MLLFSFAEEYNRKKVTGHTNNKYELFTSILTSNTKVLWFYFTLLRAAAIITRHVSNDKLNLYIFDTLKLLI